ncbi:hypothetical protein Taro_015367 [Colocasia esculenta]|uniref:Uncharacterized protein n=1 Tax=Colocasia esculenta TaxID=4460 RepID=A0A843UL39_COLES|nr:hypothetical protein [Colocasia esculenta]
MLLLKRLCRGRRCARSPVRRLCLAFLRNGGCRDRLPGQLGLETQADSRQLLHLPPEFGHLQGGHRHDGGGHRDAPVAAAGAMSTSMGGGHVDGSPPTTGGTSSYGSQRSGTKIVQVLKERDGTSLINAAKGAPVSAIGGEVPVEGPRS